MFLLLASCWVQPVLAQIVVFSEDFDGINGPTAGGAGTYSFPVGWFLVNVDNLTPDAAVGYVNEAWERREDFNFNVGDSCAFSTSWYNPAGTADDWMWTPPIAVSTNNELRWNAVTYDPTYPDGYEVRIMVAPNVPTGSTGILGNMVTHSTVLFSTAAENTSWTSRSVSLSAYAGQTVRIAFRNISNDQFLLLIDDVEVVMVVDHDAELVSTEQLTEYSLTPLNQVSPYPLQATIKNSGINTLTQVQLNVEVYNSADMLVHSSSSAPLASLASGSSQLFDASTFTPLTADTFEVVYITSILETDDVPTNDTMRSTLIITVDEYARDRGNISGAVGIGAGNGGYVGQDFDFPNECDLSAIKIHVTRGYTGEPLAVVVWDMTGMPPTPNQIIASTDTVLYPSDDAATFTLPISGGTLTLPAGRYAFTAVEFDSTIQVAQTDEIFTFERSWVDWPTSPILGWANIEDFGASFQKAFIIRPILANTPPQTWYLDADGDGWYAATQEAPSSPGPGWTNVPPANGGGDCDDDDDTIHPGAMEICDGIDNDCNGQIDNVAVPTGITSTVLTATSVYIDWNDSPDADRWQVRYRVQGSATWTTTANLFVSNTTLMGLLANNIYQFQVRARCTNANNSAWSATQTFFLNTCFAPTGLAVTNITSNSALVNWNAAAGAISYMIRYRKIGKGWTITSSATTSKTLTGLMGSSNYEVQVASFCTSGAGGWSGSVYFTTAGAKTNGISLSTLQPQSSQIDWSIYPNPGQSGQSLSIELQAARPEASVLSILDLQGRVIFQQPWSLETGFNQLSLNDLKANTGLYFVTIRLGDRILSKRWVVQE